MPGFDRCERPTSAVLRFSGDHPGRFAQGPDEKYGRAGRTAGVVSVIFNSILTDGARLVGEAWPTDTLAHLHFGRQLKFFAPHKRISRLRALTLTDSGNRMNPRHTAPGAAKPLDWLLLLLIIAFGGSAFVMIRNAVETMPPPAIAVGRLWVGAIVLYAVMKQAGRRFPPFFVRSNGRLRVRRSWGSMIAVGLVGNVAPFFIFPWAQQFVESGLAGIYMAFMPIWTLGLAYLFAGESLSVQKLIGFALGLAGVIVLMGPEVFHGVATSSLVAQLGLLFATFLYAASAVLSRRARPIRPRVFAAGMLLVAAITATPALFFIELETAHWSWSSMASVLFLGVFPTGINGVLIIMVIRRAGAGFMALSNYITPIWAVALGGLIYHERLDASAIIALVIILAGVAISQRRQGKQSTPAIEAGDGLAGEIAPIVEADSQAAR